MPCFDAFVILSLSSQLGNTALHIAAGAGYQAVVKLLMEYGASPLIENKVWYQLKSLQKKLPFYPPVELDYFVIVGDFVNELVKS